MLVSGGTANSLEAMTVDSRAPAGYRYIQTGEGLRSLMVQDRADLVVIRDWVGITQATDPSLYPQACEV
jgi:hypothetical protein